MQAQIRCRPKGQVWKSADRKWVKRYVVLVTKTGKMRRAPKVCRAACHVSRCFPVKFCLNWFRFDGVVSGKVISNVRSVCFPHVRSSVRKSTVCSTLKRKRMPLSSGSLRKTAMALSPYCIGRTDWVLLTDDHQQTTS